MVLVCGRRDPRRWFCFVGGVTRGEVVGFGFKIIKKKSRPVAPPTGLEGFGILCLVGGMTRGEFLKMEKI